MNLHVIFRSCTTNQVHTGNRIVQPKADLALACMRSLVTSLYQARENGKIESFTLDVVDDHSDEVFLSQLKEIMTTGGKMPDYMKIHNLALTGNDMSMQFCYNYAYDTFPKEDYVYFVEDDYLHRAECITECADFIELARKNLGHDRIALHPFDDPDNYKPNWIQPTYIVLGTARRWRTNHYTTWTCMVPVMALHTHWERFWGLAHYGQSPDIHEGVTINHVWRDPQGYNLFTPIPTLSWHMQFEENQSPFADWKPTYNRFTVGKEIR